MTKKNYFNGLEGVTSRFISLILTLIFFAIYAATKGNYEASWFELTGILTLFVVIYEVLAYVLFIFFSFFARNKISKIAENDRENQIINN